MIKKNIDTRIIQTKEKLFNALSSLIKNKSLQDITVIDLVEEAEINRSTFYLHYRSLHDFMIEFENKLYNEFRK